MSEQLALVVELCGRLADAHGSAITVPIPLAGFTVTELFAAIRTAVPALGTELDSGRIRACVNEAIVPASALVRPDDVVALFPPVSGG